MTILYLLLFCSSPADAMLNKHFFNVFNEYVNHSRNVIKEMNILLSYMMPKFRCVQVIHDESVFSNIVMESIYRSVATPSIMFGKWKENEGCKGFVIVIKSENVLEKWLQHLPRWDGHRLLIIIDSPKFISMNHNYKNADILCVFSRNMSQGYQISNPSREVRLVENFSTPWETSPKGYKNFNRRKIKAMTGNCSSFSSIGLPQHNNLSYVPMGGYEMVIFMDIVRHLNLSVDWQTPNISLLNIPLFTVENWHVKPLEEATTDVAFCAIIVSRKNRKKKIEMTNPYKAMCLKFLSRKRSLLSSEWNSIFLPFALSVWVSIALSTGITTLILQRVATTSSKHNYNKSKEILGYKNLGKCFQHLVAILVLGSFPRSTKHQGASRYILTGWALYTVIITTCFSSSLISNLTQQRYSKQVNKISEFLKQNYHWSYFVSDKPDFDEILDKNDVKHFQWMGRARPVYSVEEMLKRLENPKEVVFGAVMYRGVFLPKELPGSALKRYEAVRGCYMKCYTAYAFPKGSSLTNSFNRYVQIYLESGIIEKLIKDEILQKNKKHPYTMALRRSTNTFDENKRRLGLNHLKGIFQVWIAGLILSTVIFVLEFLQKFHI